MNSELLAAGSALLGALIGAVAGIAGAFFIERMRSRQARREKFLSMFSTAIRGGTPQQQMESKVWLAVLSEPEGVKAWADAVDDPSRTPEALSKLVLDVVNEERATHGRKPLTADQMNSFLPIG